MKPVAFTAIAALLGACSTATTTTAPTVGSIGAVAITSTEAKVTTPSGASHVLLASEPYTPIRLSGAAITNWAIGAAAIPGNATANRDPGGYAIASGLDGSTYFAGISGTPGATVPASGIALLTGVYGFVVNGTDQQGPLALTANFGSGTLTDTSPNINIDATISGTNITGSVNIAGELGALKGGFYTRAGSPLGYEIAGAALGTNMAGILVAN